MERAYGKPFAWVGVGVGFSKQNMEKPGQKCEYEDREEERSDPGWSHSGREPKAHSWEVCGWIFLSGPCIGGPLLKPVGICWCARRIFLRGGPKNTLVWKQHPLWRKAQITASAVIRLSSRVLWHKEASLSWSMLSWSKISLRFLRAGGTERLSTVSLC